MNAKFVGLAVVLGLLSAIGPFAIDMYLPALPSIGGDLKASPGAVQMTLLIFFLTIGFGQLIVGPFADMVGAVVAERLYHFAGTPRELAARLAGHFSTEEASS